MVGARAPTTRPKLKASNCMRTTLGARSARRPTRGVSAHGAGDAAPPSPRPARDPLRGRQRPPGARARVGREHRRRHGTLQRNDGDLPPPSAPPSRAAGDRRGGCAPPGRHPRRHRAPPPPARRPRRGFACGRTRPTLMPTPAAAQAATCTVVAAAARRRAAGRAGPLPLPARSVDGGAAAVVVGTATAGVWRTVTTCGVCHRRAAAGAATPRCWWPWARWRPRRWLRRRRGGGWTPGTGATLTCTKLVCWWVWIPESRAGAVDAAPAGRGPKMPGQSRQADDCWRPLRLRTFLPTKSSLAVSVMRRLRRSTLGGDTIDFVKRDPWTLCVKQ